MRILFFGDVVGRSGCDALLHHLPKMRQEWAADVVIANGENAAAGFGITPSIAHTLLTQGVNVITTGNHIWDKPEIIPYIQQEPRLIRPLNSPPHIPGKGAALVTLPHVSLPIVVVNVMGRVFMEPMEDPFTALEHLLSIYKLGVNAQAIIVDMHAEAASEKMGLAHFFDGRVSCVVGTHSHIPTADAHILKNGTAYQTDAGMCGDYNSVIGMDLEAPIARLRRAAVRQKFKPAQGEATLCGVLIEVDPRGKARWIRPFRWGGILPQAWPVLEQEVQ